MTKYMILVLLGWVMMGCGARAMTSGEGVITNPTFTSGGNGPQRVTMTSTASDDDGPDLAPVRMTSGPRRFGMGMPGGGMVGGTVLEGRTTHVRYVPLHRPEVGGYIAMVENNTSKYLELDGDGVATCNRDSIIRPDERNSKWHVRVDRDGVEHYLLRPGARVCLTIDPDDACPPNTDVCGAHVRAVEYSFSTPVVRRGNVRGRDFRIPVIGGEFEGIRFDP